MRQKLNPMAGVDKASSNAETKTANLDEALYPGTSISLHVALVLILAFVINHKN